MASFRLSDVFLTGTVVRVYAARSLVPSPPQPGQQPPGGVAAASVVVDGEGVATFTGLAPETAYFAGGEVSGLWRWVGFRTESEGAGLTTAEIQAIAEGGWPSILGTRPARPTISGQTIYVSAAGSDANSGRSEVAPYATVAKALTQSLAPGDGVLLRGGDTFTESFSPSQSGTEAKPIVFGSYGHGNAKIVGQVSPQPGPSWLTFDHLTIVVTAASTSAFAGWGHHIRVQNCNLTAEHGCGVICSSGLRKRSGPIVEDYLTPPVGWEILSNFIHETGDSGILIGGSIERATHGSAEESEGRRSAEFPGERMLVQGNVISRTGIDPAITFGKHGLYLKAKSSTVRRNLIVDFSADGVSQRYSNCAIEENVIQGGEIGLAFFQYGNAATLGESEWRKNLISNVNTGLYTPAEEQSWTGGVATVIPTAEVFALSGNQIGPIWGTTPEFIALNTTVYDDGTNATLGDTNNWSVFLGTNPRSRFMAGGTRSEGLTLVGYEAGAAQLQGSFNTLIGWKAGIALGDFGVTTSKNVTAVGAGALLGGLRGLEDSTAIGARAMQGAEEGPENVAVGAFALMAESEVLKGNASRCVAVGFKALTGVTTGGSNVAVGHEAGKSITTASANVAVGQEALARAKTTGKNVAIGQSALAESLGVNNVAIGAFAAAAGAGSNNVVVGQAAGLAMTSAQNVLLGFAAGEHLTTGGFNVFVGDKAGQANVTGTGNLYLGHHAGEAATGSNELIVSSFGNVLISGNFSTPTLGLYKKSPVPQAAAIASPAETLASLKAFSDTVIAALKGIGITA